MAIQWLHGLEPLLWNLTLMCSRQNMVQYIEESLILCLLLVVLFEQFSRCCYKLLTQLECQCLVCIIGCGSLHVILLGSRREAVISHQYTLTIERLWLGKPLCCQLVPASTVDVKCCPVLGRQTEAEPYNPIKGATKVVPSSPTKGTRGRV